MVSTVPGERVRVLPLVGFAAITLGMGITQGSLVPLVGLLPRALHVSLPAILVLYSLLSWALLFGSFAAGAICFRAGARPVVWVAATTLGVGLLLRAATHNYLLFSVGQAIADLTLPFCFGPIGSVLKAAHAQRTRLTTALLFGAMPGGAGIGSVLEAALVKSMGLGGSLWVVTSIGVVFAVFGAITTFQLDHLSQGEARAPMRLRPNAWWLVIACIFSIPNILQAVFSPAVHRLGVTDPVAVSGLMGFLANWGAAIIPIGIGALAEYTGGAWRWVRILVVADVVVLGVFLSELTGVIAWSQGLAMVTVALQGGTAYSVFALLNSLTAQAERGQRQAGVSTSMLSVSGNVAASLLTPSLGSLIAAGGVAGDSITLVLAAIGAAAGLFGRPLGQPGAALPEAEAVE